MPSGFAMASGSGSGSLNGWPAYRAAQAYRTWLGLGNLAPSNPAAGAPATPRGVAAFDLRWTVTSIEWKESLAGWIMRLEGDARSAERLLLTGTGTLLLRAPGHGGAA